MKTKMIVVCLLGICLISGYASAQVMTVHQGNLGYQLDLTAIDSLTFSTAPMNEITNISIEVNSEAYDGGGNLWILQVSALVETEDSQPAPDSFMVMFEVFGEDVTISGASYIGNESIEGITTPGVAFAELVYHSSSTNDLVDIEATVMGGAGEINTRLEDYSLPIQEPDLLLNPETSNFFFEDASEVAVFETDLFLMDGHGQGINNQLVQFHSDTGFFHTTSNTSSPVESQMLTGDTDEYPEMGDGQARRYLLVQFFEAFPDPAVLVSNITISGVIVGTTTETEEVTLHCST